MNTKVSKFVLGLLIGMWVFSLSAAPANRTIENISVKTVMQSTFPDVRYSGSLPISQGRKRFDNSWMMIVVEFTPRYKDIKGNAKVAAAMKGDEYAYSARQKYLDNVEVKVRGLCETVGPQGLPVYALLNGSCKLWYIKMDNTRHSLVFFVPPWILDRYYYPHSRMKGSKNIRNRARNAVKAMGDSANRITKNDLFIEVVFLADNTPVAFGYANVTNTKKEPGKVSFARLLKKVPAGYSLDNAILSKGQSPWAHYDINIFDPEKPVNGK